MPNIARMKEREDRLLRQMMGLEADDPRHKQMERTLIAARKRRKRLEREAKDEQDDTGA
jgi:hypothetical protein